MPRDWERWMRCVVGGETVVAFTIIDIRSILTSDDAYEKEAHTFIDAYFFGHVWLRIQQSCH